MVLAVTSKASAACCIPLMILVSCLSTDPTPAAFPFMNSECAFNLHNDSCVFYHDQTQLFLKGNHPNSISPLSRHTFSLICFRSPLPRKERHWIMSLLIVCISPSSRIICYWKPFKIFTKFQI